MTRGGQRKGSGRPEGAKDKHPRVKRTDRTERLQIRLTPEEHTKVKKYIKKIREDKRDES